jgi:hypothetical protein
MLALDSLVTDLIFAGNAAIDQKTLIEGLGGQEVLEKRQLIDVDRLDPRAEMELSPSMPFRHRGERRLLMIDDSVAPLRPDPEKDLIVPLDLRPFKEALIHMCETLPLRAGRLFALGSWGDAVMITRSAEDLRAIALIPWALDPQTDVDGKRRQTPLSQKEFEAKLMAYEKRLEELDEAGILARLAAVPPGIINFERRGELFIVDVLEVDGTWDLRKSLVMEAQLAAVDRFSMIPGAPSIAPPAPIPPGAKPPAAKPAVAVASPVHAPAPAPPAEPQGPPIQGRELDGTVVLVIPGERLDGDVIAALGKRDWDHVVRRGDHLPGALRDRLHQAGGAWVAPLEFLSEVFVDGKPLSKALLEADGATPAAGVRTLEVHYPRFGPVMLVDVAGKGRFVTSLMKSPERVVAVLG